MIKKNHIKKNIGNEGSTLITVIVAIAFVTILTSIILGSSVVNLRMKAIDRRTKDDFYFAEKGLNDIYTGIGQITAKTAADEYEKEFSKVGKDEDYELSEYAENKYKQNFIDQTAEDLKIPSTVPEDPADLMNATKDLLNSFIVPIPGIACAVDSVKDYAYEYYNGTSLNHDKSKDGKYAERIRLIGVQVTSTDDKGFQAVISTDIVIELPTMDFLSANVDVTDYSIIANKGLYINGDANINGNVYAGIHKSGDAVVATAISDESIYLPKNLYGGINIKGGDAEFYGNYIVSKGDINLSGDNPKLTVGRSGVSDANLPNIYFDTLRTCRESDSNQAILSKTVDAISLNANIFALNDLELNADNSKVTIKGNYYGYNDKTLPEPSPAPASPRETFASFSSSSGHDDADSSAIIINGSHSTLDMKGIRSLVLMGRAYVDFSEGGQGGEAVDASSKVAATAEAVALKTNQQMYLVPTDLLDGPNPVLEDDYGSGFKLTEVKKTREDGTEYNEQKIKDWFGYDFIDETENFKTYKVTLSDGSKVYYAYLNFNNKLWVKYDASSSWTCKCGEVNSASEEYCHKCERPAPIYVEYTGGGHLGTGGSVSSMEAFFDIITSSKTKREKIMNDVKAEKAAAVPPVIISDDEAAKEYEIKMGATPSPYTVYSRVVASMGYKYFDLQDCIVGDGLDSAIIYSQNSIVSYETKKKGDGSVDLDPVTNEPIFEKIEKKNNNVGMERYANYPQNLFHRYQWLAERLDANQDLTLEKDPNNEKAPAEVTSVKNDWNGTGGKGYKNTSDDDKNADAPPLCRFVALDKIIGKGIDTSPGTVLKKATDRGLSRNSYGDCVIKDGNLVIGSGEGADIITVGTKVFKGIAIVNGNITVKANTTVNGLLMATGAIIIEDGVTINYDKGLLQARIEKELANIRAYPETEPGGTPDGEGSKKPYYLTTYLTQNRPDESAGDSYLMYKAEEGSKKRVDRVEPDYHNFMFYENWSKGPRD